MFKRHVGKPTKIKKAVYLLASMILGVLLSVIAHGLVEIGYLKWAIANGQTVEFYNGCAFLPAVQVAIIAAGIAGGFFLGKLWWRIIYVDRVWEKKS